MGASGSGISTLLNLLPAPDRPSEGSVLIEGADASHLDDDALTLLRATPFGGSRSAYPGQFRDNGRLTVQLRCTF